MDFESIVFDDSRSVYIQIVDFIKKLIVSGELGLGDRIPSVREMSAMMKVNVNTMQRAYKELEGERVTITKRGMGSFVTDNKNIVKELKSHMAKKITDKFISDMKEMGYSRKEAIDILGRRDD